jgi:hypothetical protein
MLLLSKRFSGCLDSLFLLFYNGAVFVINLLKKFVYSVLFLIIGFIFVACPTGTSKNSETDGINWDNEPNGTLEVINNTSKDLIIFLGQIPNYSSILGGVNKSNAKIFDISAVSDDVNIGGGYMILRGMTIEEYNKNKSYIAGAKAEYTAIVTYDQGKIYRAEINQVNFGDYCFIVNNTGQTGIELRKDRLNGEKIIYLPPMSYYVVYTNSRDGITIYPVYIFYNQVFNSIISFNPNFNSWQDYAWADPRPITHHYGIYEIINHDIMACLFPTEPEKLQLQELINNYPYNAAFIRCTNNVPNYAASLRLGETVCGKDVINPGETLTFMLPSTAEGKAMDLNMSLLNEMVTIPVKQNGDIPVIKNGYIYNATLDYTGYGIGAYDPGNYTSEINGGSKLNIFGEVNE